MSKHFLSITFVVLLTSFCAVRRVSAQQLAISHNLAYDAALTPNLGVEFILDDKHTMGISGFSLNTPYGCDLKASGIVPQYRYWISGRPFVREYIGLIGLATTYKGQLKNKRYDGDAVAFGVCFGYAWVLTKRLSIEVGSSVGYYFFKQKSCYEKDLYAGSITMDQLPNDTGTRILPIQAGITLTYIIK